MMNQSNLVKRRKTLLQKKVNLAQMAKVEAKVEANKEGEVEVEEEEALQT